MPPLVRLPDDGDDAMLIRCLPPSCCDLLPLSASYIAKSLLNSFYGSRHSLRLLHAGQTPSVCPNLRHPYPHYSNRLHPQSKASRRGNAIAYPSACAVIPHTQALTYLPTYLGPYVSFWCHLTFHWSCAAPPELFQALTHAVAEMFLKPHQSHRKSASC